MLVSQHKCYSADSVCRRKSCKAYCFHPSLIVRALSSLSDSAVAALAVDVCLLKAGRFQLAVGESGSSPGCSVMLLMFWAPSVHKRSAALHAGWHISHTCCVQKSKD